MSDKHEMSVRIGERTHSIVKRKIVADLDIYDSTKEFYEISVGSNALNLQTLGAGGKQARDICDLLDNIRGMTVPVPEDEARAYILNGGARDSPCRLELSPKHLGI